MTNIAINLRKLITEAGLSEHELGRRTGVKQSVINRLLSGQNINPTLSTLSLIANFFMVSVSQLIGEQEILLVWKGANSTNHLGWVKVPLYHCNAGLKTPYENTVMTECQVSDKAFALIVSDSSMEPIFPEHCIIIVEPKIEPDHGDYVAIKPFSKQIIIRHFLLVSEVKYSSPLNNKFGKISKILPNEKILGTVIRTIYDHKTVLKT